MKKWMIAALATTGTFLAMDFTWLSLVTETLYRPAMAPILAPEPNFVAAGLFYLIYIFGILVLVVRRSHSISAAAMQGAVLGLVSYSTYDLTNLATLRDFSVAVTLADLAWGIVITAVASSVGYSASRPRSATLS